MRIALITDAWSPQVNGVVRTLTTTAATLQTLGHEVLVIEPSGYRTWPCPGYPEIRLARWPGQVLVKQLEAWQPEAVHIATEGPLGWAARRWCLQRQHPFTTSCHTRFPEYLRLRAPIPLGLSYAVLRRFHQPAARTMVRSHSQRRFLMERGFNRLCLWPGAVDTALFRPGLPRPAWRQNVKAPVAISVGRLAAEKSLDDFLQADWPGSKVVVGDGPDRQRLQARYPEALFLGWQHGLNLASAVAAADVFVFPSQTDTLGLVMLEAMACGVPVAAYPVPGPLDVVLHEETGYLHADLGVAMQAALHIDPVACRSFAVTHSWQAATQRFAQLLVTEDEQSAMLSA